MRSYPPDPLRLVLRPTLSLAPSRGDKVCGDHERLEEDYLILVRHLLTSYRLPMYSSLYGSQLPAVMCTLHVRVAQVLNALEGLRGKSNSLFTFTQPNQSNAELLDH